MSDVDEDTHTLVLLILFINNSKWVLLLISYKPIKKASINMHRYIINIYLSSKLYNNLTKNNQIFSKSS